MPAETAQQYLPGVLADIAEACGLRTALTLAMELGGSKVFVPRQPKPHTLLVKAVGLDAARRIARLYAGENIEIPLGSTSDHRRRRAEIRKLLNEDLSAQEIARRLGVHYRTVRRVKNAHDDQRQPGLFDSL